MWWLPLVKKLKVTGEQTRKGRGERRENGRKSRLSWLEPVQERLDEPGAKTSSVAFAV